MAPSLIEYSGGKLIPQQDLRMETAQVDIRNNPWYSSSWMECQKFEQNGIYDNLRTKMDRLVLDVGTGEVKCIDKQDFWSGNYWISYSKFGNGIAGVGIIISKKLNIDRLLQIS